MEHTHSFLISRLLSYGIGKKCYWQGPPITVKDVISARGHVPLQPSHETRPYNFSGDRFNPWHIGRVLYFAENPDKISAISIDAVCDGGRMYAVPVCDDGNHRLMGAIIVGMKRIPSTFGGIVDLCEYLDGKTNIRPHADLCL